MSRRVVIAGAAWSVPAIAMMSASPAFASSTSGQVVVSGPAAGVVAGGSSPITAKVTDAQGTPSAGAPVSLTAPSGVSFAQATGTTDSSGMYATTMAIASTWVTPGSTVTVSAVSGSNSSSTGLTVLGANALVAGANMGGALGDGGAAGSRYDASLTQLQRTFPARIVQLASSGYGDVNDPDTHASFAVLADGSVWAVGGGGKGLLGQGTTDSSTIWKKIPNLPPVSEIAAGFAFVVAATKAGEVYGWGDNNRYQTGDPSAWTVLTPTKIAGLSGVTKVRAMWDSAYALLSDGTLKAWGSSSGGSLGNGTNTPGARQYADRNNIDTATPVTVSTAGPVKIFAGGIVVLTNGDVQTWGGNGNGERATGATSSDVATTPTTISFPGTIKEVVNGGEAFFFALMTDNTVKAWGKNNSSQLGNGTWGNPQPTPTTISNLNDVIQVTTGMRSGYALLRDGTVKAWGYNNYGQLGTGDTWTRTVPTTVPNNTGQTITALTTNSPFINRLFTTTG